MKTLLVNGSPHKGGCTFTALNEVSKSLIKNGIECEIFHIGNDPVRGCSACGRCKEIGRCVFDDDCANELAEKLIKADAMVIGSPVYYAGPNGALCALLDRVFYSRNKAVFAYKPAAAIMSCRRSGATATFDRLNKYFTIHNMFVVSSQYWNNVHGYVPKEVIQDLEGMQIMRQLGENMAYLMKMMENTKGAVEPSAFENRVSTNFMR